MISGKIKKWGNSFGVLIPKQEVERMHLAENQEVTIEVTKKENPLRELFGFGKRNKISRDEFLETRRMLEKGI